MGSKILKSVGQRNGEFLRHLFKPGDSITGASLLPIRLTLIYLAFSLFVYAFGPFDWPTSKPVLFYTLNVLYMAALWFGYRIGIKKTFSKSIKWTDYTVDKWIPILSILIVVNYLIYVVNIFRDYGMQTFDFAELFRQMLVGIKDPGLGYHYRYLRVETLRGDQIIGGQLFSLFNYIWSFFRYPILLTGMLRFRKLKIWGKLFMVIYLITMVLFYLSIGTTIDILHVFLLLELPVILDSFTVWHKKKLTKKHIIKLIASVLAGVIFILSYFTWMMVSRGGINNYDQPDYNVGGVHLNENVVPSETLSAETLSAETLSAETLSAETGFQIPPIIMKFWISFSSYFTQGYYGMAQALELPWTPMFGVGNSMFLVNFISEHVYDIDQFTYQMKVEQAYGWDSDVQWSCMYTWLANDYSFYGVIIAMMLIGSLFGAMFKDAIASENIFAKMSIFYFILMILFIPCNNQIAQRSDTLFSFVFIVFAWLISKYPPKFLKRFFLREKGE